MWILQENHICSVYVLCIHQFCWRQRTCACFICCLIKFTRVSRVRLSSNCSLYKAPACADEGFSGNLRQMRIVFRNKQQFLLSTSAVRMEGNGRHTCNFFMWFQVQEYGGERADGTRKKRVSEKSSAFVVVGIYVWWWWELVKHIAKKKKRNEETSQFILLGEDFETLEFDFCRYSRSDEHDNLKPYYYSHVMSMRVNENFSSAPSKILGNPFSLIRWSLAWERRMNIILQFLFRSG